MTLHHRHATVLVSISHLFEHSLLFILARLLLDDWLTLVALTIIELLLPFATECLQDILIQTQRQ